MKQGITIRIRYGCDYDEGLPEITNLVNDNAHQTPTGSDARIHDLNNTFQIRYVAYDGSGEEDEHRVVGTATLVIWPTLLHECGLIGQIEDVAVEEASRKDGIGAALIEQCIEHARERGCYKIQLTCDVGSTVGYLYESLGFHDDERMVMRLDLDNETQEKADD